MFLTPIWGVKNAFIRHVKTGTFSRILLLPVDPIIYEILSNYYLPIGAFIQTSFYISLALFLGFKLNFYFMLGILSSFLAILLGISILLFIMAISFLKEQGTGEFLYKISWIGGLYPTFMYKGILFLVFNVVFPGFIFGTLPFSIYLQSFRLFGYFLAISIFLSIVFLYLSKRTFQKALKMYSAYV